MPVRTTVYLDAEVLERKQIEELMIEGYKASWIEQRDVDQDWRVVETEEWTD